MGDPAGIGPDIALFAWLRRDADRIPAFFVVGDPTVVVDRVGLIDNGDSILIQEIQNPEQAAELFPMRCLCCLSMCLSAQ